MNITEKAAYLKGLAEGLDLDPKSKETKLFNAIIDLLDDLSLTLSDLDSEVIMIGEQIDAIDEDLEDLEDIVFEDADEDYDFDCDCGCDDFVDEVFEIECPKCHEVVYFDESILEEDDDELACPACGAIFDEIIFEDDEDEED